jgi:threonine/homoserine/homoserine lactone efflux protein
MTLETLLALLMFSAATLFTPGPNNLMLLASGANFGLRRTLPHLAGVAYGFALMILPVGLGVMTLFDRWPLAETILGTAAVLYVLWLAWKIANAAPAARTRSASRPLTFLQAAGFQWVNPKAWSMALGAITLYAAGRDLPAILWIAGTFAVLGTLSALTWVALGKAMRRLLSDPGRLRLFNRVMAVLLVVSMIPVLLG